MEFFQRHAQFTKPSSPRPLQQRFHFMIYTDEQLQLNIDISSNHNFPSVLCELVYPAACYHLRPSSCLFSKMCPPLVVSLKTVGRAYLQTLEKQNKQQLEIEPPVQVD